MSNDYLTPVEAAARLRRSPDTLARWRSKSVGPRYSKPGGKILYSSADIDSFIRAAERQGTRSPE